MGRPRRWCLLVSLGPLSGCATSALDKVDPAVFEAEVSWTDEIQPLFAVHCVSCHDGEGAFDGGVELATYEAARSTRIADTCTSVSQEVIDHFADSLVLPTEAAGGEPCSEWEPMSMPPGASPHLSPTEQVVLARWVELGAPE